MGTFTCSVLLTALGACAAVPAPPLALRAAPLTATAATGETPPGASRPGGGSHAPAYGFGWPLQPQPPVSRAFEQPPQPWAAGHRGVDLTGTVSQPVLAAGPGRVTFSGVIAGRGVVTVEHANGWRTTYEPLEARVGQGAQVELGDRIGTLTAASSHCSPAACLHWGLVVAPDEYRDPLTLLQIQRVVLLPLD